MSSLEQVLVPLYLLHRYQLEATAKLVGGLDYIYGVRGDGQDPVGWIEPERQRRALEALLRSLSPRTLALPERILDLLPPPAEGLTRDR